MGEGLSFTGTKLPLSLSLRGRGPFYILVIKGKSTLVGDQITSNYGVSTKCSHDFRSRFSR